MEWILVLAGMALGAWVWAWIEARLFVVRHLSLAVLPPGASPIRILHVSDLHLVPRQRLKSKWVRSLARLRPDLILVTGDSLGGADSLPALLQAFEPLLRFRGVFVHGSNDYFGPHRQSPFTYFRGPTSNHHRSAALPTAAMTKSFCDAGWVDLNNRRAILEVRNTTLSFVGVDDPHIGRDKLPPVDSIRGRVHIGVAHAPYARILQAFHKEGTNVVFCGHTHGGQVCLPGFGALVTNCDLDRRRARGLSGWPGPSPDSAGGEGSMWLNVSAGVGTSPFTPLRFACRPEVSLVIFEPRTE